MAVSATATRLVLLRVVWVGANPGFNGLSVGDRCGRELHLFPLDADGADAAV
jgi:hypothetical protein